ncbi:hypothetical protein TrRE_jg12686 [Triparma retinervis]|uniref:Uncharacterized protein n=1 Tax=Triparma retinervis TaxID=2557542 RepID=A0A9W6ZB51_9STRA|nr:hypothetical protein TrRE_jg12686 [Triparma retinervis]
MSLLHLGSFTRNITQLCGRGMDWSRHSLEDGRGRVKDLKRWVKRGVETKVMKGIAAEGWEIAGGGTRGGTEELARCGKMFKEGLSNFVAEVEGKWGVEEALGFLVPFRGVVKGYCGFIEDFTSKGTAGMFGLEGVYGRVEKVMEEIEEFIVLFGEARGIGNGEREKVIMSSLLIDLSSYLGVFFYTISHSWSTGGVTCNPRLNDLQCLFEFDGHRELMESLAAEPRRRTTKAMMTPGRVARELKGVKTDGANLYEVMVGTGRRGKVKDVKVKFLEKVGESSSGGKKEEHRKEVRWRKAAAELSLLGLIKKGGGGGKDLERDALVWTK